MRSRLRARERSFWRANIWSPPRGGRGTPLEGLARKVNPTAGSRGYRKKLTDNMSPRRAAHFFLAPEGQPNVAVRLVRRRAYAFEALAACRLTPLRRSPLAWDRKILRVEFEGGGPALG